MCVGPVQAKRDGLTIIALEDCGFAHLFPRPPALDDFWDTDEHHAFLARERDEQWYWRIDHEARLNVFGLLGSRQRLLDYGCGAGHFVRFAYQRGWYVYGYDPSPSVCNPGAFVFGIPPDTEERFDAINCRLVLEHVFDPAATLRQLRDWLHPRGVLCIEVPRDFSELQRKAVIAGARPDYWVSSKHHNYFTSESLRRMLEQSGFLVEYETTTFPMEWFILMGLDYTRDDEAGRQCHEWRMNLESNLPMRDRALMLKQFAKQGWGRHIIIYARRSEPRICTLFAGGS